MFKYNKYFNSIKTDLIAINLFIIFGLLPIDKINNLKIIFFIKQITSYTGGIYYIHPEIIYYMHKYFSKRYNRILKNLSIYCISYIICCINSKIFKSTNLIYLFN